MSGGGDKDKGSGGGGNKGHKRKKKKNEKWEEAGGEFYQERYPGGRDGQGTSTVDLTSILVEGPPTATQAAAAAQQRSNAANSASAVRHHFPLPSQTARRNSLVQTGRRGGGYLTRKHGYVYGFGGVANATLNGNTGLNCMTYNSTMGRINSDPDDIQISGLMPDMADETIPDEKTTYDALHRLKALPEPLASKRARKVKLGNIPQRRLNGWLRLKWSLQKKWVRLNQAWQHDFTNFSLFQRHLQNIEVKCGTAIVNVFMFIRYALLLNLLISILCLSVIVLPYFFLEYDVVFKDKIPGSQCSLSLDPDVFLNQSYNANINGFKGYDYHDRIECCVKMYYVQYSNPDLKKSKIESRGTIATIAKFIDKRHSIEHTPFFYGFYINVHQEKKDFQYDLFATFYVLVILVVLGISLLLMVRSVGLGIKELIMASEGEHNPYTNLIFAGWDHYTKDAQSAVFKRKILSHEMKVALSNEKETLLKVLRTRNQQVKLFVIRLFVNILVFTLLGLAGAVIYYTSRAGLEAKEKRIQNLRLTRNQTDEDDENENEGVIKRRITKNVMISFVPTVIISLLNIMFPILLARIGKLEQYSTHTATALVLYRALMIRLASIAFAAVSLFQIKYCRLRTDIPKDDEDKKLKQEDNFPTCTLCEHPEARTDPTRGACWETMFGDEFYKLLMVDLIIKVLLTLVMEPIRLALKKCFKNKIIQKIGTMKFSIVRHSLDIIYLQTIVWLGLYFAPFIAIFAVFYSYVVFFIKMFSLFHNCTSVPDTLKTMKTTTTFVAAKLMAFIAVAFANTYVIGYMMPSRGCGPFRHYNSPWDAVATFINKSKSAGDVYAFLAAPTVTVPLTLLLLLAGYYYYSVAQANRSMVETLRHLLILEGHDKQYLFARLNSLRRGSLESHEGPLLVDRTSTTSFPPPPPQAKHRKTLKPAVSPSNLSIGELPSPIPSPAPPPPSSK